MPDWDVFIFRHVFSVFDQKKTKKSAEFMASQALERWVDGFR
jgi:hypothetical protein